MAKVIVAGSINLDIVAATQRRPRPGETVTGTGLSYYPGGKGANQAVAAARAGAVVVMRGAIGDDRFVNDRALGALRDSGVNLDHIVEKTGHPTGTAVIIVAADAENEIVVIPGANGELEPGDLRSLSISRSDVLVGQFEIPVQTTRAFFDMGKVVGAICILNPAPTQELSAREIPPDLWMNVDFLVVNESELATLSGAGIDAESSDDALIAAMLTLRKHGLGGAVVTTLGRRGLIAESGGEVTRLAGHDLFAVDTTGAGDCFVGCLASELAAGSFLPEALRFANAGAALSIRAVGAAISMPERSAIEELRDA